MAKSRKPEVEVGRMETRLCKREIDGERKEILEGKCPRCGVWQSIEDVPINRDEVAWFVCTSRVANAYCQREGPMKLLP